MDKVQFQYATLSTRACAYSVVPRACSTRASPERVQRLRSALSAQVPELSAQPARDAWLRATRRDATLIVLVVIVQHVRCGRAAR